MGFMADISALEQDIHDLRERVAFLDGWRQGDSERYDRLERDLGGVKDELRTLGDRLDSQSSRIDALFWILAATLAGVLANLAVVLLN